MAKKREIHLSATEKFNLLTCWGVGGIRAKQIVNIIDDFTFVMLDELANAMKDIAKGKPEQSGDGR